MTQRNGLGSGSARIRAQRMGGVGRRVVSLTLSTALALALVPSAALTALADELDDALVSADDEEATLVDEAKPQTSSEPLSNAVPTTVNVSYDSADVHVDDVYEKRTMLINVTVPGSYTISSDKPSAMLQYKDIHGETQWQRSFSTRRARMT